MAGLAAVVRGWAWPFVVGSIAVVFHRGALLLCSTEKCQHDVNKAAAISLQVLGLAIVIVSIDWLISAVKHKVDSWRSKPLKHHTLSAKVGAYVIDGNDTLDATASTTPEGRLVQMERRLEKTEKRLQEIEAVYDAAADHQRTEFAASISEVKKELQSAADLARKAQLCGGLLAVYGTYVSIYLPLF